MDRNIVYPGAIPLDIDILSIQENTMIAIGMLAKSVMGTGTFVDGLACTQTVVPGMSIMVGQGAMGFLSTVEPNQYGSMAADGVTPLVKMGINTQPTTLGPLSAPAASGQSVVYLVQAAFSEADGVPVVLPYYNSANPSTPYTGPNGSGAPQNTRRLQTVTMGLVQGSPATTGSQTTPAPTVGYTGLYAVTVANGQVTVTAPNIAALASAPFVDPNATGRGIRPGRYLGTQRFLTAGTFTYTPTPGAKRARVTVQAAGGGAAGAPSTPSGQSSAAGDGGGGAWAVKDIVLNFTSALVVVGAGGNGGTGDDGHLGGDTSFNGSLAAQGGTGGSIAGPTGATSFQGTGGNGGGVGTSGDQNAAGRGGLGTQVVASQGLPSPGGFGFVPGFGSGAPGNSNPPSAGPVSGQPGQPGCVIIEEYA